MKSSKALSELRALGPAFLAALDSTSGSSAMLPFAHLLRALADDRPLPERIEWSVSYVAPLLTRHHSDPKIVQGVRVLLERNAPYLPLAGIPCDKAIAKALKKLDAENYLRHFGAEIPDGHFGTFYASTWATT